MGSALKTLQLLADLDRYYSLLDKLGPEPSIGRPFGGHVNLPNIFFVDSVSGAATNSGRRPDDAVATIDAAVGLCTANTGDLLIVLPGHVEAVGAANALDLDVAGISVIGGGQGSDRPQISLRTAVGAQVRINAASVHLENVIFTGDFDNVTIGLLINGVADVTLKDIEYRDVTGQIATFLSALNNSDRLTIDGLRYIGAFAPGTVQALLFDGCDDLEVKNVDIYGDFSTGVVDFVTTLSARVHFHHMKAWTENAADVIFAATVAAVTGFIGPDCEFALQDDALNGLSALAPASVYYIDPIYIVNAVNEKAAVTNKTASGL